MNNTIKITDTQILSDHWYKLKKITYQYNSLSGETETTHREVYDRGNGVVILLYNKTKNTVILTRQFRMPTYVNQNPNGMMIEACAGVLDESNPDDCIIREVKEETGYEIKEVHKLFQAYMSPGAVTEILHFYVAEYKEEMKVSKGGGLAEEHEYIEVLEMDFEDAYEMIFNGKIKDSKTIMLLQHVKIHKLL